MNPPTLLNEQIVLDALRQGPVRLVGPVGAGKTELMGEVARRLGVGGRRVADVVCRNRP